MISFDNFGVFFKENGKKAVDTAKETAAVAKYKASIKAEELKMSQTYAEIGRLFCEKYEGEVDEIFVPLMQKISDSKANIANSEAEIDKLRNTVTCPACGAKSPVGSKFCSACGKELPEVKKEDEAEDVPEEETFEEDPAPEAEKAEAVEETDAAPEETAPEETEVSEVTPEAEKAEAAETDTAEPETAEEN